MASAILLGVVTAVTSAIVAGQHHALEAEMRIAGSLAADAMMNELIAVEYAQLSGHDGLVEEPGDMLDEQGDPLPAAYSRIGRSVAVNDETRAFTDPDVTIAGKHVIVRTFDAADRTLAQVERFFPEPAE